MKKKKVLIIIISIVSLWLIGGVILVNDLFINQPTKTNKKDNDMIHNLSSDPKKDSSDIENITNASTEKDNNQTSIDESIKDNDSQSSVNTSTENNNQSVTNKPSTNHNSNSQSDTSIKKDNNQIATNKQPQNNNQSSTNSSIGSSNQDSSSTSTENNNQSSINNSTKPNNTETPVVETPKVEPKTDLEEAIEYHESIGLEVTYNKTGIPLNQRECDKLGQILLDNQETSYVYRYECEITSYESANISGLIVKFKYNDITYQEYYDKYYKITNQTKDYMSLLN